MYVPSPINRGMVVPPDRLADARDETRQPVAAIVARMYREVMTPAATKVWVPALRGLYEQKRLSEAEHNVLSMFLEEAVKAWKEGRTAEERFANRPEIVKYFAEEFGLKIVVNKPWRPDKPDTALVRQPGAHGRSPAASQLQALGRLKPGRHMPDRKPVSHANPAGSSGHSPEPDKPNPPHVSGTSTGRPKPGNQMPDRKPVPTANPAVPDRADHHFYTKSSTPAGSRLGKPILPTRPTVAKRAATSASGAWSGKKLQAYMQDQDHHSVKHQNPQVLRHGRNPHGSLTPGMTQGCTRQDMSNLATRTHFAPPPRVTPKAPTLLNRLTRGAVNTLKTLKRRR